MNKNIVTVLYIIAGLLAVIIIKLYNIELTSGDMYVLGFIGAVLGVLWMIPVLACTLIVAALVVAPMAFYGIVTGWMTVAVLLIIWAGVYDWTKKRLA